MTMILDGGAARRSFKNLSSCGDATVIGEKSGVRLFAVIDALGHGPDAEQSARRASSILADNAHLPLQQLFEVCDRGLAGLREIVIAAIRVERDVATYAGIGNVEIHGPPGVSRPPSMTGTVGKGLKRFKEFPLAIAPGQRWILVSDGIQARQLLAATEAVSAMFPERAARELVERAGREDDDVSALVLDVRGEP
jgi:hypothetical protein